MIKMSGCMTSRDFGFAPSQYTDQPELLPSLIRVFTIHLIGTVMILNFRTDRSGLTVQTQIRLLLEEQSDQGLHCLLFHLHAFDKILFRFGLCV